MGLLTSGNVIVFALLSFISPVSIARKYVHRMHRTLCANTGFPSTVVHRNAKEKKCRPLLKKKTAASRVRER